MGIGGDKGGPSIGESRVSAWQAAERTREVPGGRVYYEGPRGREVAGDPHARRASPEATRKGATAAGERVFVAVTQNQRVMAGRTLEQRCEAISRGRRFDVWDRVG